MQLHMKLHPEKENFIKLLIVGRQSNIGAIRFEGKWINRGEIVKDEKVSCCYADLDHMYDHVKMREHCRSERHIVKLVARRGFQDEYLLKEIGYYAGKILTGEIKPLNEER